MPPESSPTNSRPQSQPKPELRTAAALPPRLTACEKADLQRLTPSQRFAKNGYAVVTHRLLDIHRKISGHAQQILVQEIIHATFGAKDNPEWALIKLRHLEAKSRYGRKAFETAADDAADRGLIERLKRGRSWLMKVVPEDWDSVPDYIPAPPPVLVLVEGGRQRDPMSGRFVLGAKRPVAMSDLHIADPAQCRFVQDVETLSPVEVSLNVSENGLISVVVRDVEKATLSPASAPKVHRLFASELTPIFLKTFEKTPDDAIIAEIVKFTRGAPPEKLLERIEEKRRTGALKSPGLVLELARDVGKAWVAGTKLRAAAEHEETERVRRRSAAAAPRIVVPLDPAKRWDRIRAALAGIISAETYSNWFERTRQISETADSSIIEAPDGHTISFVGEEFASTIEDICKQLGEPTDIVWTVAPGESHL